MCIHVHKMLGASRVSIVKSYQVCQVFVFTVYIAHNKHQRRSVSYIVNVNGWQTAMCDHEVYVGNEMELLIRQDSHWHLDKSQVVCRFHTAVPRPNHRRNTAAFHHSYTVQLQSKKSYINEPFNLITNTLNKKINKNKK